MNRVELESMPELPYAVEEAINRLRVNINFCGSNVKKIMIISTMPNEGKSFIAMHLWRLIAEAGTGTVLVDADLRKSVMVSDYGIKGEDITTGTSSYLADTIPLSDTIYKTNYEEGHIIPNIDNVINPSLLLESSRFENMLDQLSLMYRYVIIDAPPLNLVSDGEKIGSLCDGAILVVRSGKISKEMVKNSARQLQRAGCPLLGVILNRVEGSTGGYYYKKYGGSKYYGKKGESYYYK